MPHGLTVASLAQARRAGLGVAGRALIALGAAGQAVLGMAGRALVVLGAAGLALGAVPATPAAAHGADAPDATNYRTEVTSVAPAVDGLTVRVVEAGARIELENRTGRTIEVLGYEGEPYLEVRPDGAYSNVHSPAMYLNETLSGTNEVPPIADPARAPVWQRVSSTPIVRWHDHRTHWMASTPPAQVVDDPGREHRIRDWTVPLRDNLSTVDVNGTLDWVPPPAPVIWWGVVLVVALAIGAAGLAWDRLVSLLAALAVVASVVAIGYAVARELDAGAITVGGVLSGLLRGQAWPVLTSLAAIAAAGYALRRRPAADLALGLAGACLALIAGAANAAVFARGVAPVVFDALLAREAVALVIGVGAGLALAAGVRLRLTRQPEEDQYPSTTRA